eukprot:gene5999-6696_t
MALQRVNARFLVKLTQRVMSKDMPSEEVQQLDVAVSNFRNSVRDVLHPVVMNDLERVEQSQEPFENPLVLPGKRDADADANKYLNYCGLIKKLAKDNERLRKIEKMSIRKIRNYSEYKYPDTCNKKQQLAI